MSLKTQIRIDGEKTWKSEWDTYSGKIDKYFVARVEVYQNLRVIICLQENSKIAHLTYNSEASH